MISQSCQPGHRRHRLAHAADAALGVGERAVLFKERRARQEHVRVTCRLVQEQILHDHALHRRKPGGHVLRVRVGLRDVLALDVDALEVPSIAASNMFGMRRPGSPCSVTPPCLFEHLRATASSETWR